MRGEKDQIEVELSRDQNLSKFGTLELQYY